MFRKITLEDKKYFDQFNYQEYIGSELNFANIYAWKDQDKLEIFINDLYIIIKGEDFLFPPMTKDPETFYSGLDFIKEYCFNNNFPFRINGVTHHMIPYLERYNLKIFHNENFDEYLYEPNSLITYSGKKLHSKRNFVNQFTSAYQFEFVSYDSKYNEGVLKLIDDWTENKGLTYEKLGIISILKDLDKLDCFCDCLIVENEVIAFSIGTIFNNTGIVLFEKANLNYKGSYPMIVQQFARKHFQGISLINRQEDMGIENLKKSKLSYRPTSYVEKYQAVLDQNSQLENIYATCFNDSKQYQKFFFNSKEKQIKYITKRNLIASNLYYRDHIITINDNNYQSAFLFAIATSKFYQKQGYMKELIYTSLNEFYPNYIFVYLHPDVENFYEKFGFSYFGSTQKINNNIKTVKADLNNINSIYQEYTNNFNAYTNRDIEFWFKYQLELSIDQGYIEMFENEKGYIVNDGINIIEYVDINNITSIKDYNMIRIINLQKFIDLYNYKPTRNIKIIDDIIDKNNIEIIISDGEIEIISIKEFTDEIFSNILSLSLEKY